MYLVNRKFLQKVIGKNEKGKRREMGLTRFEKLLTVRQNFHVTFHSNESSVRKIKIDNVAIKNVNVKNNCKSLNKLFRGCKIR